MRNNNTKFCQYRYCKYRGHNTEECRKKQFNEKSQSRNAQGGSKLSAKVEAPRTQMRSTNVVQTEDPFCKILQLEQMINTN